MNEQEVDQKKKFDTQSLIWIEDEKTVKGLSRYYMGISSYPEFH